MSYTRACQVERVSAGRTNYSYSILGLGQETSSGTTAYTRDNQGTLVSERTPSGTYDYLFGGLGSTVALTDSTGAVKNTFAYDPYGKVPSSTGSVANRFGGAYGSYTDSSGLVKIKQRYYDPSIGRWTQQDLLAGALTQPDIAQSLRLCCLQPGQFH
jgi:RHS repeat-associated protein